MFGGNAAAKVKDILFAVLVCTLFCGGVVVFMLAIAHGNDQPLFVKRQIHTLQAISINEN